LQKASEKDLRTRREKISEMEGKRRKPAPATPAGGGLALPGKGQKMERKTEKRSKPGRTALRKREKKGERNSHAPQRNRSSTRQTRFREKGQKGGSPGGARTGVIIYVESQPVWCTGGTGLRKKKVR